MNKILKMSLAAIGGVVGACIVIWLLSTTAGSLQEASARGETIGILLGVTLFVGAGILIFKKVF
jgi:hypothetical protein